MIKVYKVKDLLVLLFAFNFLQKYFLSNKFIIDFKFLIKCTVFFFLFFN